MCIPSRTWLGFSLEQTLLFRLVNGILHTAPRVALTWLTPPGRRRSKGNWALVGARGVLSYHNFQPL